MFSRVGVISFNAATSHRGFFALDILGSRGEALPLLLGRRHRPKPDWGICGRRRWIEMDRGRFHRLPYCRMIAALPSTNGIGISGCDPAMVFPALGGAEFRATSSGSRRVRSSGQRCRGRHAGEHRSRSLRADHLYPDPEGRPADSAVPKQTSDGRDFVAVFT